MNHDVFGWNVRLKRVLKNIKNSKKISRKNKEAILRFYKECITAGITKGRTAKYLHDLKLISTRWTKKDYEEMTKEDIKDIIIELENYRTKEGKPYSEASKCSFKLTLRKLFQILRGFDWKSKEYPPEVDWLSIRRKNNNNKLPDDILTIQEVRKLVEASKNDKERAFVSVLYESGCRIGEMLALRIKHVQFDEYGAKLVVNGKTGARRVRIVESSHNLERWISKHPESNNPNAWLWINRVGKPMTWKSAWRLLKSLKKRAGIKKAVNPHNFRHSRATHLANKLTEAQLRMHFGWVKGSNMPEIYVHLAGRDVDDALLEYYGIAGKTRICHKCKTSNPIENQYCKNCGVALNKKAKETILRESIETEEANKVLNKLVQNEEFRELLEKWIRKVA